MSHEKELQQVVRQYQRMLRKMKAQSGFDLTWQEVMYCVLEVFYVIEGDIDQIIAKRYARGNAGVGMDIKVVFLSKLDFSRKIAILEEIQEETGIDLWVNQIRMVNNLRNAFVHNYPRGNKGFRYKKGHICDDLKIKDFFEDMTELFKKLSTALEKVKAKQE